MDKILAETKYDLKEDITWNFRVELERFAK